MKMALAAMAVAFLAQTPTVDAFLKTFAEKRAHIEKLEATFTQDTTTPDESTRALGRIVYERPRRILLQYSDPNVVYLVDGSRVYQYNAQIEQVQIYDLESDPQMEALFLGFDENTERLREAYTLGIFDSTDGCGTKGLRLIPLKERKESTGEDAPEEQSPLFQEVELLLREQDYLPCHIHVVNDAESNVEIRIEKVTINADAGGVTAQIEVPEGTSIIENETLIEKVGAGGKRIPERPTPVAPPQPKEAPTP
jgi:outer membrane lipoprotein-sorting protein